jgi:predicted DNA-binding protein
MEDFDAREATLNAIMHLEGRATGKEETKAVSVRIPLSMHDKMTELVERFGSNNSQVLNFAIQIGLSCMVEQADADDKADREGL